MVQRWATAWMIGGSRPRRGSEFLSSPPCPDRLWGPPSLLINGYLGSFPGEVNRPGREADHSPPSSAVVRMRGAIPPLPYTPSWYGAQLSTLSDMSSAIQV
jgi:hypothetical protein